MIKVKHLVKSFGANRAVDDISFSVERGEVLGFLGPNGAGKSTTMRIAAGFYPPTSGSVTVGGFDIVENPHCRQAFDRLSARERTGVRRHDGAWLPGILRGFARLDRRGEETGDPARGRDLFSRARLYQTIDTLSKGYKHRTCLAQSIIHDPDILILDEPTDGLDPNQKHEVRGLIKRMASQ